VVGSWLTYLGEYLGSVWLLQPVAGRAAVLMTPAELASPLAARPYDLGHTAVSTWLNAGVPATPVAEWAGHTVAVLLTVYAKCIVGQDKPARDRIEVALREERPLAAERRGDRARLLPATSRRYSVIAVRVRTRKGR
jgi:hypothetical protein